MLVVLCCRCKGTHWHWGLNIYTSAIHNMNGEGLQKCLLNHYTHNVIYLLTIDWLPNLFHFATSPYFNLCDLLCLSKNLPLCFYLINIHLFSFFYQHSLCVFGSLTACPFILDCVLDLMLASSWQTMVLDRIVQCSLGICYCNSAADSYESHRSYSPWHLCLLFWREETMLGGDLLRKLFSKVLLSLSIRPDSW